MSIRRRLTIGVTAIVLGCLAVAFAAVYAGTGDQVRQQLDTDLQADLDAFSRVMSGVGGGTTGVQAAAQAYLAGQPYAPNARLLYARLPGAGTVSNDPDLVGPGRTGPTRDAGRRILATATGTSDVALPDGHRVRLRVARVSTAAGPATLGVGENPRLITRAQTGVLRSFLLAGLLAIALATLAAVVLATRLTEPLRRMAGVAARIQEGDLGGRMGQGGRTADEGEDMAVLAHAFDSMLDRVQAAFDRQSAFVADASHELRTPLTVIRGQLEVLALDAAPDAAEVRRVDRLVRIEVDRMGRMVEDLLILARAQEDTFLRRAAIAIPAVTADLLEAQMATAPRDFRHEAFTAGTLTADPDRLAQVIRNLLRNAIEHTKEGGLVCLWVRHEGSRLSIGVDDDGPGIPEAERARVFDRFHRADARGPRGAGTGTGLGLAIVQVIAQAHGGRVWAAAAPAGGARVVVELPGYQRAQDRWQA